LRFPGGPGRVFLVAGHGLAHCIGEVPKDAIPTLRLSP
jgi:hypothetical protein